MTCLYASLIFCRFGFNRDVTGFMERDDIVTAIEVLSNSRMHGVLDALHLGILIEDENRNVKLVNKAFLEMFGISLSAAEFSAINCDVAAQGAKAAFMDEEGFIRGIRTRIADKTRVVNELLGLKDGRFLHRHYYPLFVDTHYRGHAWVYTDVSESVRLEQELKTVASTDALTRLKNRRQLEEDFNQQLVITRRYSRPLSILLCDIDHFKRVNDTYGHNFGDEVLRAFAGKMRSLKRTADIFGRWGGEEFLWILPETDLAAATIFAERIREEISRSNSLGIGFDITFSGGLHQCNPENEMENAITEADRWLYAAKRGGRNRIMSVQQENLAGRINGVPGSEANSGFYI
jgi:diguanylate cyclase (GGDEF)-like protein